MRRHDYTRASLIVSLACMMFFGGYVLGAKPPQAGSSGSSDAESSRVVEDSLVTLQYVATVRSSTGIDYGNVSEFIQGRHEIVQATGTSFPQHFNDDLLPGRIDAHNGLEPRVEVKCSCAGHDVISSGFRQTASVNGNIPRRQTAVCSQLLMLCLFFFGR